MFAAAPEETAAVVQRWLQHHDWFVHGLGHVYRDHWIENDADTKDESLLPMRLEHIPNKCSIVKKIFPGLAKKSNDISVFPGIIDPSASVPTESASYPIELIVSPCQIP